MMSCRGCVHWHAAPPLCSQKQKKRNSQLHVKPPNVIRIIDQGQSKVHKQLTLTFFLANLSPRGGG